MKHKGYSASKSLENSCDKFSFPDRIFHHCFKNCPCLCISVFLYVLIVCVLTNIINLFCMYQGMNEILGPIYYTFATDPDQDCRGLYIDCMVSFLY